MGEQAEEKNEIIAHEWLSLQTLWEKTRPSVTVPDRVTHIDGLFPTTKVWKSGAEEWNRLNEAEQAVGSELVEPQLTTEFNILLALAKARQLSDVALYEKMFAEQNSGADAAAGKRTVYLGLLDELQRGFINTRFKRRLRRETASQMLRLGLTLMALTVLPFAIYFVLFESGRIPADGATGHLLFSSSPYFGLGMVAVFGMLGAYFSRIMRFQTNIARLDFEDVMNEYQPRMLYVRILYGMIGAFVFYFLLRSGILGGTAFPKLDNISVGEQIVWKATSEAILPSASGELEPSGLSILAPTAELAKLLVWSFLAGFSERLVPDALERTAARAEEKETT